MQEKDKKEEEEAREASSKDKVSRQPAKAVRKNNRNTAKAKPVNATSV